MRFTDEGIILGCGKFSENAVVVTLLTETGGIYKGLVKGAHSKTNRGTFLEGNIVNSNWNARLPEHLGSLTAELIVPVAAMVMADNQKLLCLRSAVCLIAEAIPEREPHPRFYNEFKEFLEILSHKDDKTHWLSAYVLLELALLRELGFGLDLSECAATGTKENLIYVSPKSGRAVCAEAGEPYKDKLFKLPEFLTASGTYGDEKEIRSGIALGGYFLERSFNEIRHKATPLPRDMFVKGI